MTQCYLGVVHNDPGLGRFVVGIESIAMYHIVGQRDKPGTLRFLGIIGSPYMDVFSSRVAFLTRITHIEEGM